MNKENGRVLIVDDEKGICFVLSQLMQSQGFTALVAHDGMTALRMIPCENPDMVLVDFRMPGMNGMEMLIKVKALDPDLPVVMITAFPELQGAVRAMKAGAHDYLAKPFDNEEVIRVVQRALTERSRKQRLKSPPNKIQESSSLREMMGPSNAISKLIAAVDRVAKTSFTVLIVGETGTGKELVARAIHQASPRSEAPFLPVDCGAIAESLIESELFGHEKGAFTGADTQKPGKFEAAQKGTLFLDEISSMPLGLQAKFLRALQEKTFYRVGSTKPFKVDVRLLAASNYEYQALIDSKSFRTDLFFRLNEFTITVPPLRERTEDIPYLSRRFLEITNEELKKSVKGFSEDAIEALISYNWPGNVRQLRSIIRRAVLLANDVITMEHLDIKQMFPPSPSRNKVEVKLPGLPDISFAGTSFKEIVHRNVIAIEREILVQALKDTGGNMAKAARLLQIDYKTIHTKVKEYVRGGNNLEKLEKQ